jgi:hypothetical protein
VSSCLRRSRSAELLAFERDRQERGDFQLENRSEDCSSKEQRDDVGATEERDAYDNDLVTPLNDDMNGQHVPSRK